MSEGGFKAGEMTVMMARPSAEPKTDFEASVRRHLPARIDGTIGHVSLSESSLEKILDAWTRPAEPKILLARRSGKSRLHQLMRDMMLKDYLAKEDRYRPGKPDWKRTGKEIAMAAASRNKAFIRNPLMEQLIEANEKERVRKQEEKMNAKRSKLEDHATW